jgi:hypothetical protein
MQETPAACAFAIDREEHPSLDRRYGVYQYWATSGV